jgi:diguanylate cyclase (GGDEF)-like protein
MNTSTPFEGKGVRRYAAVAFIFGLVLTLLVTHFVYTGQKDLAESNFEFMAKNQAENIKELVMLDVSFIGAGASFYHATEPPAWDNFSTFARAILDDTKSLLALQWMKKVYPEQIESHIMRVRDRFPNYQIYTVPKGQPLVEGYILENDEPIFVASDIYPVNETNLRALGYYSSRERVRRVIESTIKTGQPSLSDKIRLLQDGFDRSLPKQGMLVYHPVFEVGQNKLRGVVIGVIRTTVYFEQVVTRTSIGKEIGIQVRDLGFDAEDDPILYRNEAWERLEGESLAEVITLYDRQWSIEFKRDTSMSTADQVSLIVVFSCGLIISTLAAYIVLIMFREQRRLAMLVSRRTKDLQYLVERDPLTEVYNRRAFNRLAGHHISCNKSFSLIIIDVDNFKLINDKYGHVVGDEILKQVAVYIREQLYPDDLLFRLGGDEFAVISRSVDKQLLSEYLNKVCVEMTKISWNSIDPNFVCSLSIGASVFQGESLEVLMNRADELLYKSKKKGRNIASVA